MYNRFLKANESKTVSCSDSRCALSFDSIQDHQCHCQNVHCVERIKLDSIKRHRRTHQSSLNVKTFLDSSVKLEHHCDLLNEESSYKHVNERMKSQILDSVDTIVLTESVKLREEKSSLFSIDSTANQKKRSSFAASFTSSENSLSIIDWISNEIVLDNLTSTSSVYFDLSLSIDSRLLNEIDSQSIILSS